MSYRYCAGSTMCHGKRSGNTDRSGRRFYSLKSIGTMLLVLALLGVMTVGTAVTAMAAAPASGAQEVTYPASKFDNGKAHHFEYKTGDGVTVKYFIMKSSDGIIRAAFDACDVCWRERKGYVQKDDFMLCRNCGRQFPSARINVVSGGCNPAPLTRKIENGKVVINTEHILEGKRYFAVGGGRS